MSDCEYTQVSCLGVINSDSLERRAKQNRILKSDERERNHRPKASIIYAHALSHTPTSNTHLNQIKKIHIK